MISTLLGHAAASVFLSTAPSVPLADVYVDISGASCATGDGTLGNPVCSISTAIGLALPGDTIRIAPGTYVENVVIGFDLDLVGTGGASATMIDGGGSGTVITIPSAVTVTIDGVTISGGDGPSAGGIDLAGDLLLSNSTVTGNSTSQFYGGGAIYQNGSSSSLTVTGSEFSSNTGDSGAGAISSRYGLCTLQDSSFTSNQGYSAGAILLIGSGAVGVLTIEDCTFDGNGPVPSFAPNAGAILQFGGTSNITGSTFVNNIAHLSGGAIAVANSGQFTLTNSTITQNEIPSYGSLYGLGGTDGGGVFVGGGAGGSISSSTITSNVAGSGFGGGVFVSGSAGAVSIQNTIIAENLAALTSSFPFNPSANDTIGSLVSLGHNLIGTGGAGFTPGVLGDQAGSPMAPLDPRLGSLLDNGGPTETREVLPGSPALNAGDPLSFEPTDQRGVSRPQGTAPDIGAFESEMDSEELCNGDGGDGMGCTSCPCMNDGPPGTVGGCLHSGGASGRLTRSGSSSVATADLRFEARDLPANTAAILLSGTALAPANPSSSCFGLNSGITSPTLDGLRCIVQGILRHGVRPADANGAIGVTTNGWGTPSGFFNFGAFMAGQTRFFQVTYRDSLAAICQTGLNTTQASSVTFVP